MAREGGGGEKSIRGTVNDMIVPRRLGLANRTS